jgi:hypothetical protein
MDDAIVATVEGFPPVAGCSELVAIRGRMPIKTTSITNAKIL